MTQKYSAQTIAFGAVDKVTRQIVVDDSTGERANLSYDKATGAVLVEDTVDPDSVNPVSGRAVAEAVAGASGEVPIIGSGDNGKVLTAVVDGESKSAEWADAPTGVPSTQASDNGKVLGVTDTSGTLGWVNQPVSNVTTADKQFTVGVNGTGHDIVVNCPNASSVAGSTPLPLGSYDASGWSGAALTEFTYDYSELGALSGQQHATITIPQSGTFSVPAEYIKVSFFYTNEGSTGNNLFSGGEDVGSGWPDWFDQTSYTAGTYTLPGQGGYSDYDGVVILVALDSTGDYTAQQIAAAKAELESVMSGWTISWPSDVTARYEVTIPEELPSLTGNGGKVLKVNSGATGVEWANESGGGGSASISDIIRDINAANVQGGQTMQDWVNGLVSDIQAGKLIRLIATAYSGDSYTDIAYLDHYIIADSADPNDHMGSSFYFRSARFNYYITNPDNEYWELGRNSV